MRLTTRFVITSLKTGIHWSFPQVRTTAYSGLEEASKLMVAIYGLVDDIDLMQAQVLEIATVPYLVHLTDLWMLCRLKEMKLHPFQDRQTPILLVASYQTWVLRGERSYWWILSRTLGNKSGKRYSLDWMIALYYSYSPNDSSAGSTPNLSNPNGIVEEWSASLTRQYAFSFVPRSSRGIYDGCHSDSNSTVRLSICFICLASINWLYILFKGVLQEPRSRAQQTSPFWPLKSCFSLESTTLRETRL